MYQTQKKFEETITVINEGSPTYGSGGIAIITDGTSKNIKAVMMPDMDLHRETRKEGQFEVEVVFAQVRKSEMDKIDMIPGKTRITWNGYTYRVRSIIDYRSKPLFKNAEIEMRRRIGIN